MKHHTKIKKKPENNLAAAMLRNRFSLIYFTPPAFCCRSNTRVSFQKVKLLSSYQMTFASQMSIYGRQHIHQQQQKVSPVTKMFLPAMYLLQACKMYQESNNQIKITSNSVGKSR